MTTRTYNVWPVEATEPTQRQYILHNPHAATSLPTHEVSPAIERFHQQLPEYAETALHALPDVAEELGFAHVFVKDESTRFGLPSFKMAGASWAIHKALCRYVHLSSETSIAQLRQALQRYPNLRLVTCTAGNWGRATARMAKYLGVRASIYVPFLMEEYTRDLIRKEGAEVCVVDGGDYDQTMAVATAESKKPDSILVLDVAFDDFHDIPQVRTAHDKLTTRLTFRSGSAMAIQSY